jgi:hypothetical protein
MYKQIFSLFVTILTSGILLQSCNTNSPSLGQDSSKKIAPVTPTSTPLPVVNSIATSQAFNSVESLEADAELVVVAKPQAELENSTYSPVKKSESLKKKIVLNESVVIKDDDGSLIDRYTITSVKILKVLKGKTEEKELKVLQPAALVGEAKPPVIIAVGGYWPLKKDNKYVLFLSKMDTKVFPNMVGVYGISSVGSKFNLANTDNRETAAEAKSKQFADLKAKVIKKYEAILNTIP